LQILVSLDSLSTLYAHYYLADDFTLFTLVKETTLHKRRVFVMGGVVVGTVVGTFRLQHELNYYKFTSSPMESQILLPF
jgi:hypothetical protein